MRIIRDQRNGDFLFGLIVVRMERARLAELVGSLSLGIDLGFGQPMEHVLRQCLIALRLADLADLVEREGAS